MYSLIDLIFTVFTVVSVLLQGYCLQYFLGSFLESRTKSRFHGLYVMAVYGLSRLCIYWLPPTGYESVKTVWKTALLLCMLLVTAMCFYKAFHGVTLFLAAAFRAVADISAFLVLILLTKGYEMQTGIITPEKADFGTDKPQNPDLIDTIDEAADKLKNDPDYQLIDTRTLEEWNGEDSGYDYHELMGRIDGTIHSESGVGYSSSMYYYRNPDKSMRSKEILEAMWKEQGIDTGKHMAFFCGSGWRAAEEAWDAMVLGYTDVSLYSDGWIGWSNEGHPYIDKDGNTVRYDKEQNKVVPAK